MTDMNINPGTRGQTRSTWRDETHLRGLLLRLIAENPDATRKELEDLYIVRAIRPWSIMDTPPLVKEALRRAFDNDLSYINRPAQPRLSRTPSTIELGVAAGRLKNLVLLDLIQPNGKKLRDCTVAEGRGFGGWYIEAANRIVTDRGGNETTLFGEKLNETDLASILANHVQG
jgi:hypothetical protein